MEVAIFGSLITVTVAIVGGSFAVLRRRSASGQRFGTLVGKLDLVITAQGSMGSKVDAMTIDVARAIATSETNTDVISRLSERFDRYMNNSD